MTKFKVEFLFADGETVTPEVLPAELVLKSDADTPADALDLRYGTGRSLFAKEPVGAVLYKDGEVIFDGILDEHRTKSKNGVRTEFFSLRSRAALLLDNEAMPTELRMPSLRLLERLYLTPLGLRAVGGDRRPMDGVLTVEKGTNCWAVLNTFAKRYLNCVPYADSMGNIYFEPYVPKKIEPGLVTEREMILCPYKRLSGVTVQNAQTGAYNAEYHDPEAAIRRVRYLSAYAKTAPKTLLAEKRKEARSLKLVCATYTDGVPGDTAVLDDAGEMRLISKKVVLRGKNTETELTFEPCE